MGNKVVEKRMLKSWKEYNIMCSKAAILIQKRWRSVLGSRDIACQIFASKRMCELFLKTRKNQEWLLNSDSDSDSDPYEDGDEGTDAFLDQMEMLEVSIMIQKIYRGYRQRIKYKRQLHLCRAWTRHGFPQYDLEIADINHDLMLNVLDIVLLINLILER